MLPAEDGTGLCHHLLDEAVADPGSDRAPAGFGDDLGDGSGRDQVVDHAGPWLVGQLAARYQRRDRAPTDGLALVVQEEGAVGIAIKGNAQVEAAAFHQHLEISQILGHQGVGRVVGEGPVRFQIEAFHFDRSAADDPGQSDAGHPVAAVDGNSQRADRRCRHDGEEVVHVPGDAVVEDDTSRGAARHSLSGEDRGLDLGEAGVGSDRRCSPPAQLQAVVLRRIV